MIIVWLYNSSVHSNLSKEYRIQYKYNLAFEIWVIFTPTQAFVCTRDSFLGYLLQYLGIWYPCEWLELDSVKTYIPAANDWCCPNECVGLNFSISYFILNFNVITK